MDILQKNELKITVPEIIEEDEEIEYRDLPHYEEDIETEEYEFQTQEKVIVPENTDEIEETEIEITEEPEEPNSEVEVQSPDLDNISDELREQLKNAVNHLDDPEFPMTGWICSGITDLGKPSEICRLCGHQIIRYVHHMHNTQTGMTLGCGCICAGKLEGDLEKAREREGALKNKLQRKISFKKKKWKKSAKGHEYLKVKNHLMVIFHFKNSGKWTFSLDNNFSDIKFNSREECLEAIFNALDELLYS